MTPDTYSRFAASSPDSPEREAEVRAERHAPMLTHVLNSVDLGHAPSIGPGAAPRERLRVMIVPEWYPSTANPSAGVFIRDQALAVSRFHDVSVLVHDAATPRARLASRSSAIEDGLEVIRVRTRWPPGTMPGRIAFAIAAKRLMQVLCERGTAPDIIHAHVFSAGFIGLLIAGGSHPVVVSEHNTDFIEDKLHGRDARVARYVFEHAALTCPVSERLRASLEAFAPSGRYAVVPEVVDIDAFLAASEHTSGHDGPLRLVVVAMLSPQKGIEYLLDALADVHRTRTDVTLDVIGDGPGRHELEALARARLPRGAVTFHGERTRREVAAFMARSDVFVLPTVVETFGVVIVEALAAGLPIITTDAVPDPERIDGRFGIVVPARNSGALRDAILGMLEQRWSFRRDAAVEVARAFSPPALGQRWDEIYRDLMPLAR